MVLVFLKCCWEHCPWSRRPSKIDQRNSFPYFKGEQLKMPLLQNLVILTACGYYLCFWKLRGLSCSWIIINPLWAPLYTSPPLHFWSWYTQLAKSDTFPASLMPFTRGLLRMREMEGYWELRGFSFLLFASRQKAALLGLSKWPRKSLSAKLVPLFCHSQKPTWEKMNNCCHTVDASKEVPCNSRFPFTPSACHPS